MDVGGASCGGEICGVIIAGSLGRFLCPSILSFSSRVEVPAGVSGGDCNVVAGEVGIVPVEGRWAENPEGVREAGEGEAAFEVISSCTALRCSVLCLLEKKGGTRVRKRSFPSVSPGSGTSEASLTSCGVLALPPRSMARLVAHRRCL